MKYGFRYWCIRLYLWAAPHAARISHNIQQALSAHVESH